MLSDLRNLSPHRAAKRHTVRLGLVRLPVGAMCEGYIYDDEGRLPQSPIRGGRLEGAPRRAPGRGVVGHDPPGPRAACTARP